MKICLFAAFVSLTVLGLVYAQSPAKPAVAGMTVSDVQDMVKSGLSEDLVIATLRKQNHSFDLSPQEMMQLKKAGISDNVIKVMIDPTATLAPSMVNGGIVGFRSPAASGATPAAGVSQAAIEANANNPDAPHDSGIYLFTDDRDKGKVMIPLERASTQGTKTGVLGHMMTYGIVKGKTKAVIPGPHASIRTNDSRPIFYFYFEDKSAALGKSGFGAQTVSNPDQFALLKLDEKKDSREVVVGTIGFASASSGSEQKSMVSKKMERIRPGVYRVIPTVDMEGGEYCFTSGSAVGAMGAADIFDFTMLPNK